MKRIIILFFIFCIAGAGWAQNNGKLPTINTSSKTTKAKMPAINGVSNNNNASSTAKPAKVQETSPAAKQNTQPAAVQPKNTQPAATTQTTVAKPKETPANDSSVKPVSKEKANELETKTETEPKETAKPVTVSTSDTEKPTAKAQEENVRDTRYARDEEQLLEQIRSAKRLTKVEKQCMFYTADACDGHSIERIIEFLKEQNGGT